MEGNYPNTPVSTAPQSPAPQPAKRNKTPMIVGGAVVLTILLAGGVLALAQGRTSEPSPSPTAEALSVDEGAPTPRSSATPRPSATPKPSASPTTTATPKPSTTATGTPKPLANPTKTPSPTPKASSLPLSN